MTQRGDQNRAMGRHLVNTLLVAQLQGDAEGAQLLMADVQADEPERYALLLLSGMVAELSARIAENSGASLDALIESFRADLLASVV